MSYQYMLICIKTDDIKIAINNGGDHMEQSNLKPGKFLVIAACFFIALVSGWPRVSQAATDSDPLTFVVGYAAGGPFDVLTRRVAKEFSLQTGRTVIVENKPGAGGTIAAEYVMRAKPDSNILYIAASPTITVSPHILASAKNFNPKELTPIALISEYPNVLIVAANSPFKSVADLVAQGQARPEAINYASAGFGTSNHLAVELMQVATGAKFLHVPYKGSGPAMLEMLAGRNDFMFIDSSAVASQIEAGNVRALAVTSKARNLISLPEVPTMEEAGIKNSTMSIWVGVLGPKGMSVQRTKDLEQAFISTMHKPELIQVIEQGGHSVLGSGSKDLGMRIDSDYAMWGRVVKEANIQME
jgi:tripartite-type tricarboxylate transporter receptor subunit TctC